MSFATDELIQKALTQTTNWQTMIPQLWAAKLEVNLRKTSVFQQSLVTFDDLLVPGAGDQLHIPWLVDLGPVPAVQEGTNMPVQAMPNSADIVVKPTEYGQMYGVTRKMLDRIKYNGIGEILDRFAYAMQQTLETQVASLYNGVVPANPADPNAKLRALYSNNKLTGTITPTDTFNDKLLLDGVVAARSNNCHTWPNGSFRCYISPAQWEALLLDNNIRADLRFAAPGQLLNDNADPIGVVAKLHGVDLIVTNYIQTTQENGNTVFNALLVSPRWACITWKRRPEAMVDPTLYDLGRYRQLGITADFSIDLLHYARAFVLKSC